MTVQWSERFCAPVYRSSTRGQHAREVVPSTRFARPHRLRRRVEPAAERDRLEEGRPPDGHRELATHPSQSPTRNYAHQARIHRRRGTVHVHALLVAGSRRRVKRRACLRPRYLSRHWSFFTRLLSPVHTSNNVQATLSNATS